MKKMNYCDANTIAGGAISPDQLGATILGALAFSVFLIMIDRIAMNWQNEAPYEASWQLGYNEGKKIAPPPKIQIQPATFEMGLIAGRQLGHQEVALRPSAPPMPIPIAVAIPIS